MIENVTTENLAEYERFVTGHPQGSFLQSSLWARQKPEWRWHAFLRRNPYGRVTGSMAVLVRKTPVLPRTLIYGCRGPVCDPGDGETLAELLGAVKKLAAKEKAYLVKLDPAMAEGPCRAVFEAAGFVTRKHRRGYRPMQPRRLWRVTLEDRPPDWVTENFTEGHRQSLRIALQRGVTVRQGGRELAPAFAELMQLSGLRERRIARPAEYYAGLLENFGKRARIFLAECDGRIVAGALVIRCGKTATCVHEGFDGDSALRSRHLLRTMILRQAVEDGCRFCDFPGLPRQRDTMEYAFAQGFGGQPVAYLGELELVLRPVTNLLANAAGSVMGRFRRWLYFFRVR